MPGGAPDPPAPSEGLAMPLLTKHLQFNQMRDHAQCEKRAQTFTKAVVCVHEGGRGGADAHW